MATIFVSGLPFKTDESAVRGWFEPYGRVETVRLFADWQNPAGEPYALVEIDRAQAAVEALDGRQMGRIYLRVHERRLP